MNGFHKLRKATPADIDFILKLEAKPENTYVHANTRAEHESQFQQAAFHYFLAENHDQTPLGFAMLVAESDLRIEWRRIIIDQPGGGIGSAFMKAVIAHFEQSNFQKIWLDVYEENDHARHVYRSLGFEEIRKRPLKNNPTVMQWVMELKLGTV